MTCAHLAPNVVLNAVGEPVRLICPCGREWRVLRIEMTVRPAAEQPTEFFPRRPG